MCIPNNGDLYLTGFGHVADLATAMANVIGREDKTTGKVYNVQNSKAVSFSGVAKIAAKVMGKGADIIFYDPKEFSFPEGKKAFPMRGQHFYTDITQTTEDLEWTPEYDTTEKIMMDSYKNDFVHVKESGGLKNDFVCDDMIIEKSLV